MAPAASASSASSRMRPISARHAAPSRLSLVCTRSIVCPTSSAQFVGPGCASRSATASRKVRKRDQPPPFATTHERPPARRESGRPRRRGGHRVGRPPEACLEHIGEGAEAVRAWAYVDRNAVLAKGGALDRAPRASRLHGVPFGIKDIIDTADLPTEYNSRIYQGHRPKADAACVTLLRQAGCLILGKTVTTEFANNHPSQTRNPHNPAHTPGGSSSGSGPTAADAMWALALGTQTGGSVIRPAAYRGAFAIKPNLGGIKLTGAQVP